MKKEKNRIDKRITKFQIGWMFPVFLAFLEVVYHFAIYHHFDISILYGILFSLPFSFFVLIISSTKWKRYNAIVRCVCSFVCVIYVMVQAVYYHIFGNFLCIKSIVNGTTQAFDFGYTIKEALWDCFGTLAIFFFIDLIYILLEIVCYKKGCVKQISAKQKVFCFVLMILIPVLGTLSLMVIDRKFGSPYDVRMHFYRVEQSMYHFGFTETLLKDIREKVCDGIGLTQKEYFAGYRWLENNCFKEKTKVTLNERKEDKHKEEKISYQTWDIDFDTLKLEEQDEEVLQMHTYFSKLEPTEKNQYTGLFKGYHLIYITAESFSDVVIDQERTPTLYKMWEEGFQFENFYTPSWYLSTIDGEYVNCLGQIPVEGKWSLQESSNHALPMALGNQLNQLGYACNAYHNHDSYYYDRTITHPSLGYSFKAVGAGLTFESMYPESDLELMQITKEEYMNEKPFHTYYVTMSGHLPYTYDYNSMAVKNKNVIEGMELTENAACYLAANQELENAIAYLCNELEKKNQLSKTLFVIAPDHYPYGLKKGAYDELKQKEIENDEFEIYRNKCLIWSPTMKNMKDVKFPVRVEKYGSNLDLLPTILNLMGLSYDSRLLAGRDMLSEGMGLVLFKDHSFMTERVRFYATTGDVIWAEEEDVDSDYLEECMEVVNQRFYYSAEILNKDYFRIIEDKTKIEK